MTDTIKYYWQITGRASAHNESYDEIKKLATNHCMHNKTQAEIMGIIYRDGIMASAPFVVAYVGYDLLGSPYCGLTDIGASLAGVDETGSK